MKKPAVNKSKKTKKAKMSLRKTRVLFARKNKKLKIGYQRNVGRSNGKISVRHKGSGKKRLYRLVDFHQIKSNVPAKVVSIEYDPNRSADVALLHFANGEKKYVIAHQNCHIGQVIKFDKKSKEKGNRLPLSKIPINAVIYNIETNPGKGGKLVRSAGVGAILLAKEGKYATIQLPSKEVRMVLKQCYANIGRVGKIDHSDGIIGNAGRNRRRGIRPTVRGVAMSPNAHPHGGGEGRSGIGFPGPKTPWGKPAMGVKTRKKKYSDILIIKRRTKKKK